MRTLSFRAGLLLLSLLPFFAPATVLAVDDSSTDSDTSNDTRAQDGEKPKAVIRDEVFVAASPPDVPTSNTVAAKLPLSLLETPSSVSIVDRPLLEEQNDFVLGDALRNASGVNVQTGSGVYDFFVIRGLDSVSSGLILTDGAPEPETTFYQLYNVERVEVLKGPSAFLYGGSPLGGTVNLVRKQPVAGGDFGSVRVSGGSFNTLEGTLDANWASDDGSLSFRLNALGQSSDGFRDDKDSDNLAINPAFTWRPSRRTSVNFNFEVVDTQYKSDSGLPLFFNTVPDVPRERSYQSPFDTSDQDIYRFQVDIESQLSNHLTLRNKTYYRELDWLSRGTIFNGVFPIFDNTPPLVFRTLLDLDDNQKFAGDQLELLWQVETGSITHNLLFGLEIAKLADKFTFDVALLPPIELFNPIEFAQEPLPIIPGQSLGADAETRIVAPYVVDQITFSDRFQLLLGLRYDDTRFEEDLQRFRRNDDELSPMVGVVLTPSKDLSFYASYTEAFAPPSTFAITSDRVPEESRQVEVGAKRQLAGGRMQASLALYRIDRQNIAIPDDNGITRQVGDQRSKGVELELSGEIRPRLRATFAYAYNDAELTRFAELIQISQVPPAFLVFDRSGNRPAFAPEHLASLWLSQRFDSGFGVAGGARYVGKQFIAEDNLFEIDDYVTLDATLFFERGPWRFDLNLKNLTNEEYLTRGFGNTSVIPAPGFNAYGGIRYAF